VYSEKTRDDGQRNCPKQVDFYSKNKFERLVNLVGFIVRICHDARSRERRTLCTLFIDNCSNRIVSNSCFLLKKFMICEVTKTLHCFFLWSEVYFETLRSRSDTVWNPHSGTEEALESSDKNTIFLTRSHFLVQNFSFCLRRRRIKAAEISYFLLIMQYNYMGYCQSVNFVSKKVNFSCRSRESILGRGYTILPIINFGTRWR